MSMATSQRAAAHASPDTTQDKQPVAHRCGNCDAVLLGPYCAQCGQHAHASARDLGAVMHDGWHDITHVDGRLWPTLWLLFLRPGRLTADYFAERRARYLPPVRLYLVLSLVFFSLAVSSEHGTTPHEDRHSGLAFLADSIHDDADADATKSAKPCDGIEFTGLPRLASAVRAACLKNAGDDGAYFLKTLAHHIPKMMFVFLPLMAGVMALMYWRPRRYYVEHLVFLLHNHSALFFCFLLLQLLEMIARLWHPLSFVVDVAGIAVFFYVMWYPYAAMRRYFGQGRLLTASKYAVLASAYFVCLVITLLATALVTALDI